MEEHRDADEDEINREQEQAKIFLDVHVVRVLLRTMSIFHKAGIAVTIKTKPRRVLR